MYRHLLLLFIFKAIISDPSCLKGEKNCILCNPLSKLCLQCSYDVYIPDRNGGCQKAEVCALGKNYCNACDEERKICKTCQEGYFPDENGGCSYSNNCAVSYKGQCLECKDNYILNKNINICKSINTEDLRNCESFAEDGTCQKCNDGYYLGSGDKKCTKTENCKESLYEKCIECNKGFYLDKKEEKCKQQAGKFLYCKETLDNINCEVCEDNFFFDEEERCVNTNFCKKSDGSGKCKECLSGYYPSRDGNICTTTENCYSGLKSEGICNNCVLGYYIDFQDGKCKSNQEDNEFQNCEVVDGECIECALSHYLGEDHKCTKIIYCAESINGTCIECKQGYYLGLDGKCTTIKNCLYSTVFECTECEDKYFYEKNKKICKKWDENFENCFYGYEDKGCEKCRPDYYLNITDKLCYNQNLNASFFKCAKTDKTGEKCASCVEGYDIITKYNRCTNITGCIHQESENKCIECNTYRCLDVKTGLCESNSDSRNKIYYKCKKTNEDATACEECLEGATLGDDGFCA
jgi:hypothetical protein